MPPIRCPATKAWPGGRIPMASSSRGFPAWSPIADAPGSAWRLYPKTCLVLHTHMQPTGKSETVQFQIGIHFAKQPPTLRPVILRIGSRNIDIPAGESHYVAADEYVVPVDLDVRSIFPHAHSLCREVDVEADAARRLAEVADLDQRLQRKVARQLPVMSSPCDCRAELASAARSRTTTPTKTFATVNIRRSASCMDRTSSTKWPTCTCR